MASSCIPDVPSGKIASARSMLPLRTLVNISLTSSVTSPTLTVLVMSVVPSR